MIYINENVSLKCFDKNTDMWFINEINGESKSDFIHQIEERLLLSKETENLELCNAYLMVYKDEIVGYCYLTNKRNGYYYFEYSLLKQFRGEGIGSYLLDTINDAVMQENTDVKYCKLSIDKSNIASQTAARNQGFIEDEDQYLNDKMDFCKYNDYYISRGR